MPLAILQGEKAATVIITATLARRLPTARRAVVNDVLQAHLAYELGCSGTEDNASESAVNKVSHWIREATRTRWLTVRFVHNPQVQRTMAQYQLRGWPTERSRSRHVVAPAGLFDLITSRAIDKNAFLAWLRWRAMMGAGTATNYSIRQFAEHWSVSAATARRHRTALLDAGALAEGVAAGTTSITAVPAWFAPKARATQGIASLGATLP